MTEQEQLDELRGAIIKNALLTVKKANGENVPEEFEPLAASFIGNVTNLLKAAESALPDEPVDNTDQLDADLPDWDEDDLHG